jgi:hypothetical protein
MKCFVLTTTVVISPERKHVGNTINNSLCMCGTNRYGEVHSHLTSNPSLKSIVNATYVQRAYGVCHLRSEVCKHIWFQSNFSITQSFFVQYSLLQNSHVAKLLIQIAPDPFQTPPSLPPVFKLIPLKFASPWPNSSVFPPTCYIRQPLAYFHHSMPPARVEMRRGMQVEKELEIGGEDRDKNERANQ